MSWQPSTDEAQANTIKMVVGGVALALLIIFFAQNWQSVQIHVYFWTWTTHLVWALLLAAALGVAMTLGFATVRARRQKNRPTELDQAA
jgi:uncharacterized integral membrane protein